MIPPDVESYVVRRFVATERTAALRLLDEATIHDGTAAGPRLLRCAAFASGGSLEKLRYYVDLLKVDYRDVIMAGEYAPSSGEPPRVRDFNLPMSDEA